jgi:hypothetical protein
LIFFFENIKSEKNISGSDFSGMITEETEDEERVDG